MQSCAVPLIVLAEDDAEDRELIHRALEASSPGARIHDVHDGRDLIRHLRALSLETGAPFAGLVLLDLQMPVQDGFSALEEIRSDPELRQIPIVILSTSDDPDEVDKCYLLGANSYVSKPVRFRTFQQSMKTLLAYWFAVVELPAQGVR